MSVSPSTPRGGVEGSVNLYRFVISTTKVRSIHKVRKMAIIVNQPTYSTIIPSVMRYFQSGRAGDSWSQF